MIMTLEDAINHLDFILSDPHHNWECEDCRMEHEQLRKWLIELKQIKETPGSDLYPCQRYMMESITTIVDGNSEYINVKCPLSGLTTTYIFMFSRGNSKTSVLFKLIEDHIKCICKSGKCKYCVCDTIH